MKRHIDRIYSTKNKYYTDNEYESVGEMIRHKKEPYIFTVTATNAVGDNTSDPTADIFPSILPSAPKNLVITLKDASKGEISVSFESPDIKGDSIKKYIITYKELIGTENKIETTNTNNNILSNLKKGTIYIIRVSAENESGTGPYVQAQYETPELPNSPNLNSVIVRNNKEGEIEINITAPINNPNYPVKGYRINILCPSDPTLNNIINIERTVNTNPYIVKLTKNKQYSINVNSVNDIGISTPSITQNIMVPDIPNPPNTITPTSEINSIKLQFKVPDNRGNPITGYKIRGYYSDGDNIKYEDIDPITSNVSFDKDAINTVTLYTKERKKYSKTPIQVSDLSNLTETSKVTTNKTLSLTSPTVQPYDRVPLLYYPIGSEREGYYYNDVKNNKTVQNYNKFIYILRIIFIIFVILVLLTNDKIKNKIKVFVKSIFSF